MKPTLYIMIGLSASGKSTKAKELAQEYNATIVSSDAIRGEFGEVIDQSHNDEVFKLFHHRIKSGLMNGYNMIADATNISMKSRKSLINYISNVDCHIVGILMTKPVDLCVEHNIYREYPVPHHVIQKQMMNFQVPFYEEGFDEIRIIPYDSGYIDDDFVNTCKNRMKGFNQNNPHHNEDLLRHCMTVFEEIRKESDYIALWDSAIIHDIGKLYTQKTDENGISHYYQHENVGAYYLLSHYEELAESFYLLNKDVLELLFYVNYHMQPMNWNSDKAIDKWKKIFGENKFNNLLLFNKCDKIRK